MPRAISMKSSGSDRLEFPKTAFVNSAARKFCFHDNFCFVKNICFYSLSECIEASQTVINVRKENFKSSLNFKLRNLIFLVADRPHI